MTAPYIRRPWRSQPTGLAVVDPNSIFYPGVESVWNGSTPAINLLNGTVFGLSGTAPIQATPLGFGPQVSSAASYSQASLISSSPWTIAAIIQPIAAISASTDFIGSAQTVNSSTHDRSISITSTSHWAGYLYDGASKYADSGITPVVNQVYFIVVWATGSVLGVNVNGTEATIATSNSGAGYSGSFFIGTCSNASAGNFNVPLCIRANVAWDANQRNAFAAGNPWQVFTPQVRRTWIQGPQAAAAPYLPFQWWHDAGGGSMGAVLAQ